MVPGPRWGGEGRCKGITALITLSDRCQLLPNFKESKYILMAVKGHGCEGGIPQKQRP